MASRFAEVRATTILLCRTVDYDGNRPVISGLFDVVDCNPFPAALADAHLFVKLEESFEPATFRVEIRSGEQPIWRSEFGFTEPVQNGRRLAWINIRYAVYPAPGEYRVVVLDGDRALGYTNLTLTQHQS